MVIVTITTIRITVIIIIVIIITVVVVVVVVVVIVAINSIMSTQQYGSCRCCGDLSRCRAQDMCSWHSCCSDCCDTHREDCGCCSWLPLVQPRLTILSVLPLCFSIQGISVLAVYVIPLCRVISMISLVSAIIRKPSIPCG